MYVIMLDFGYTEDTQIEPSSITDLCETAVANYGLNSDITILAQSETYCALRATEVIPDSRLLEIRVEQSGADNGGGLNGGGTYFVLREACQMMLSDKVKTLEAQPANPFENFEVGLIAHKYHVPRAIRQGRLFGLELKPMAYLPQKMYPQAAQWWCRKPALWYFHELVGRPLLRLKGQL